MDYEQWAKISRRPYISRGHFLQFVPRFFVTRPFFLCALSFVSVSTFKNCLANNIAFAPKKRLENSFPTVQRVLKKLKNRIVKASTTTVGDASLLPRSRIHRWNIRCRHKQLRGEFSDLFWKNEKATTYFPKRICKSCKHNLGNSLELEMISGEIFKLSETGKKKSVLILSVFKIHARAHPD